MAAAKPVSSVGSRSRWLVILAGFTFVLLMWVPYAALATFTPLLVQDLATQRATIAGMLPW